MNRYSPFRRGHAFTLIELLIVVAIIAILAAIAVPNFLEAQARSKVTRAKADMRSLCTAIEAYYTDFNSYPYYVNTQADYAKLYADTNPSLADYNPFIGYTPRSLTTPMAYMTSLPKEVFTWKDSVMPQLNPNPMQLFFYDCDGNYNRRFYHDGILDDDIWGYLGSTRYKYILGSIGPDGYSYITNAMGATHNIPEAFQARTDLGVNLYYDPTNGTISQGDIYRPGPGGDYEYHKDSNVQ